MGRLMLPGYNMEDLPVLRIAHLRRVVAPFPGGQVDCEAIFESFPFKKTRAAISVSRAPFPRTALKYPGRSSICEKCLAALGSKPGVGDLSFSRKLQYFSWPVTALPVQSTRLNSFRLRMLYCKVRYFNPRSPGIPTGAFFGDNPCRTDAAG